MRMTIYKLLAQTVAHISDIELPFFVAHLRIEHDVKQQVSQLFANFGMFVLQNSIAQLIHFLNRLRPQTLVGLFSVPRAFHPKFIQDVEQPPERIQFLFPCIHRIFVLSNFINIPSLSGPMDISVNRGKGVYYI